MLIIGKLYRVKTFNDKPLYAWPCQDNKPLPGLFLKEYILSEEIDYYGIRVRHWADFLIDEKIFSTYKPDDIPWEQMLDRLL